MFASDDDRQQALKTNCIAKCNLIKDRETLVNDLRQILKVIDSGIALTAEAKLAPGNRVRVRSGPFAGYEGNVIRREGKTRLLLSIQYLAKGVSMEMDEGVLEPI